MAEPTFPTRIPETDDGAVLFSVPFPTVLDAESLAALKGMAPIIIRQPVPDRLHPLLRPGQPFLCRAGERQTAGPDGSRGPGYTYANPRGTTCTPATRPTGWI